jgi:phosphoribosylamine---glycine ligase
MRVLIVGGGGREHALAWKLAQSPQVQTIYVAPGNGGTDTGGSILNLRPSNLQPAALAAFALTQGIDLTVVGPEAPLAEGFVDICQAAGLRCFGPTRAAARLESSKAYAKDFMALHSIPTAAYAVFDNYERAAAHLRTVDYPIVIKASGLAAGKGVIVPADAREAEAALHSIMVERTFGSAGDQIIIEERLEGPELSVLAFSDGTHTALMPAAQDHKRAYDGDRGPNTGGMGAYAPAPLATPELLAEVQRTVLQPTLDGMQSAGTPYIGVLYAGLMLTRAGLRVLEFNCRFGDPETQVILPLLDGDLADTLLACVEGRLAAAPPRWRPGSAAAIVAASGGYPGSYTAGHPIHGIEQAGALPETVVFQAGTRRSEDGQLLTDGGRVLAVTGTGTDLRQALARAYAGIECIHFEGMHYRRDIGSKVQ